MGERNVEHKRTFPDHYDRRGEGGFCGASLPNQKSALGGRWIATTTPGRYCPNEASVFHSLRSLTYFDDAEGDADPILFEKVSWIAVKKHIQQEAVKI